MIGKAVLAFAQLVILARVLSPKDLGLVALTLTVTTAAQMIADMGISNALIHHEIKSSNELRSLYWFNVLVGGGLTLIIFSVASPISEFYASPDLAPLISLASFYFLVWASAQQFRVLAEKNLKLSILAKIEVGAFLAGFVATIATAPLVGASAVVGGFLINAALNSCLCWFFLRDGFSPKFRLKWQEVKRYLGFGSKVFLTNLINTISLQADVMVAGKLLGAPSLAFYSQPRELCLRIMFVINPIITRVAFPMMSIAKNDTKELGEIYHRTLRLTASTNFPLYGFIAAYATELTQIVLGPQWGQSAHLLTLLAIWCAFRSIGNPSSSLLFAAGHTTRALVSSILVMTALFVLSITGSYYGYVGIVIMLTVLYVALLPLFWLFLVRPVCQSTLWDYHIQLFRPAICTCAAVGFSLLLASIISNDTTRMLTGLCLGCFSYLAMSYYFNRLWLLEMLEFVLPVRQQQNAQ